MTHVNLIGIDLAKSIFHLHAVDTTGKCIFQRQLKRHQLLPFLAQQPACQIAFESGAACHHWARAFERLGHQPRIIHARHVKAFANTRNKNDAQDARAITKAARDADTLFVAPKSIEQQSIQAIHTTRDAFIKQRTATINRIRALLVEFGLILPKGRQIFMKQLPTLLEQHHTTLPEIVHQLVQQQYQQILQLNDDISIAEKQLKACLKQSPQAQQLQQLPGVGLIISTAMTYMIADPTAFKNGRQCAAALGLTPKEHSSGGKQRLGSISAQGNAYLRKNLVQGAQSVLKYAHKKQDPLHQWAYQLKQRRGNNIAAVAVANKITRIAWAMLAHRTDYQPSYYQKAA